MFGQQPVGFGGARNPGAPFGAQPVFNNAPHQRGPVQPHQYNARPVKNAPVNYPIPTNNYAKPHGKPHGKPQSKQKVEVVKQNPLPTQRQQHVQVPVRKVEQQNVYVVKELPKKYSQSSFSFQSLFTPLYNVIEQKVQQPMHHTVQQTVKAPFVQPQTSRVVHNDYNPFKCAAPHSVRQIRAEQVKARSQFPTTKVIAGVAVFCLAVLAAETRLRLLGGILTIAVGAGIIYNAKL